jgi:glutamate-1-semialdehyde 2,1-aminomutase
MGCIAPEGDIYQAGTLSGNPLAMAAGLKTLKILQNTSIYDELEEKSEKLFSGLLNAAQNHGISATVNRVGSMGSLFFSEFPIHDFASAKKSESDLFIKYYQGMLELGIYLAPSPFEACFLSTAHDVEALEKTIECAEKVFSAF